jgi:broad specificity phosphatase PhoE
MRTILQNTRNVDHVRFNLTLVRHAETHANADGIIQGLTDTELSNIGCLQSQALGRRLQNHCFSHIYTSDLKRAVETARQIRSINRVSPCEIQFDSLLRERMYGIAQGRTRQWLRELAKENGIPYINYTPPGAETTAQVRERAIAFFRKLCQELLQKFGTNSSLPLSAKCDTSTSLPKQDNIPPLSRSVSSENITSYQQTITNSIPKRSLSTGNIQTTVTTNARITKSCQSSIDSALDLSSVSSDQQSISSSISTISRNSSFEKHRNLLKGLLHSPYENDFSDLDILIVSHGAVIRELIKYFACDLQTDIGQHFDTIQDIAPNTSVTRFKVTYSTTDDRSPTTTLELVDYHNKTHLINSNNEEFNLDVINKCNL